MLLHGLHCSKIVLKGMSKSNTWLDRFWLLSFRQGRQQGVQIASCHAKVHRRIIFAHIREAAYCGPQRPAQHILI